MPGGTVDRYVILNTDPGQHREGDGAQIVDPGWHASRPVHPEDVLTMMYSVMGIDWFKKVTQTFCGSLLSTSKTSHPRGAWSSEKSASCLSDLGRT